MVKTIVIDNGTAYTKVGFGGRNFPTSIFPTMVGRPVVRTGEKIGNVEVRDLMIGDDAAEARAALDINYPFNAGIVKDWDDMQLVWDYAFSEKLNIDPSQCKIMLTEPPMNSKKHREKVVEVMFERFGVQGMYVGMQAVCALYARGVNTGLVLDSGDSVSHAVPVVDGYIQQHAIKRMNLGGRDVTEYLIKLLLRRGYVFNKSADFDLVRQIKERLCYTAVDMQLERKLAYETCVLEQSYKLPDDSLVRLGTERFEAPEVLFQPHLVDKEGGGLTDMIYSAVQDCSIDLRKKVLGCTVLSGASTLFPGLPTRIINELRALHLKNAAKGDESRMKSFGLKLEDPPGRRNLVFAGAAVLAEYVGETAWMTKEMYAETGAKAIWSVCS